MLAYFLSFKCSPFHLNKWNGFCYPLIFITKKQFNSLGVVFIFLMSLRRDTQFNVLVSFVNVVKRHLTLFVINFTAQTNLMNFCLKTLRKMSLISNNKNNLLTEKNIFFTL